MAQANIRLFRLDVQTHSAAPTPVDAPAQRLINSACSSSQSINPTMVRCRNVISSSSAVISGRMELRLGLVGCSWFALRAHLPALLSLEQPQRGRPVRVLIAAVCSRTRKSMAKAEARLGRTVVKHKQMEAMFADPEIDVVLLVLPIPLMARAVEMALRSGKHVLSEKPAAHNLAAALTLLALRRSLPQPAPVWAVLENWAHKPSVVWIRQRLQERAIGRVLSAHCAHHEVVGARGWAEGWRGAGGHEGGWLLDLGVHWVRMLRMLLGEATACSASVRQLAPHLPPVCVGSNGICSDL
jgi:predicted dehydrogenase